MTSSLGLLKITPVLSGLGKYDQSQSGADTALLRRHLRNEFVEDIFSILEQTTTVSLIGYDDRGKAAS